MATLDQVAIRTIFVHPNADPANLWPTHRLLADLGHEITSTSTLEEALRLMEEEGSTDLLILEEPPIADAALREEQIRQIRLLPPSHQPRDVAIFSERPKEFRSFWHMTSPRIHVLVKPLHMHGLLQVIRHLDARVPTIAN